MVKIKLSVADIDIPSLVVILFKINIMKNIEYSNCIGEISRNYTAPYTELVSDYFKTAITIIERWSESL